MQWRVVRQKTERKLQNITLGRPREKILPEKVDNLHNVISDMIGQFNHFTQQSKHQPYPNGVQQSTYISVMFMERTYRQCMLSHSFMVYTIN